MGHTQPTQYLGSLSALQMAKGKLNAGEQLHVWIWSYFRKENLKSFWQLFILYSAPTIKAPSNLLSVFFF